MDTLNDIISGLKWGDLDPVEAHDRVLALFSVSERFNLKDLRDAYNGGMANIDSDGCHIDDADTDFGYVVQDIYCSKGNAR